ncbi:hypothetical protein DB346_21610 [Verrucomicrobia bacterium LW23]|nr:hypothetical protein DB346_21610 [Verrucomicrobia bacterium LW23]
MSKSPFLLNLLFLLAVTTMLGLGAYAAVSYQPGDIDYLKKSVGTAMKFGTRDSSSGFLKIKDQNFYDFFYSKRYPQPIPSGVEIGYAQVYHPTGFQSYVMWAMKGNTSTLKSYARAMNCYPTNESEAAREKGASPFEAVLPGRWRDFTLYSGKTNRGDDLRIYIDEEKGRAYMTEAGVTPIKCDGSNR